MRKRKQWWSGSLLALVLLQPSLPVAAASLYHVSVDTSSLSGSTGLIDMQFNPGDITSPPAFGDVLNFASLEILTGPIEYDGFSAPALTPPGRLAEFYNGTPFNAALLPVTFNSSFHFDIAFYGDYETAIDGAGTRFSLSLLDGDENPLATVDPVGTILQFELVPGGAVNATTFDADFSGAPSVVTLSAVPVPAALPLLVSALGLVGFMRRRARASSPLRRS